MKHIFELFLISEKISITQLFNRFIYVIRKLPFIGKKLGSQYAFYGTKKIINNFIPFFSILWQLVKSLLAFILIMYLSKVLNEFILNISVKLGSMFYNNFSLSSNFNTICRIAFVLYVIPDLYSNSINDNSVSFFFLNKNFNFYPKDLFYIYTYFYPLLKFIGRSMALYLFFVLFMDVNPIISTIFSLSLLFYEINKTAYWTYVNDKDNEEMNEIGLAKLIFLLILTIVVSILILSLNLNIIYFSFGFFLLNALYLPFSVRYINAFDGYASLIERSIHEFEKVTVNADNAEEENIKIKDEDISENNSKELMGFEYLNSLFFIRHRRHILNPILIKTGIFLIAALILFIITNDKLGNSEEFYKAIIFITPIITYFLLKQDIILSAFYKNCDRGLMYYGFYRENKNLLSMFIFRFKSILKNMIYPILAIITIYLIFALKYLNLTLVKLIFPIIYIILNGVFFTILPLFQYYMFQPFDKDGNSSSWILTFMNIVIYIIFIFVLPRMGKLVDPISFLSIMSIGIIIFTIVSGLLIYKFATDTFKIKQ